MPSGHNAVPPEHDTPEHEPSHQGPARRGPSKGKVLTVLGVVGIAAVGTAVVGVDDRAKSMQEVGAWTDQQAAPTVRVVQAKRGPGEEDLTLPGTVSAYSDGSLYARASGYVTSWSKDIGARVRKGEVLAEISAPDLDQQLAEAKAQLIQLQAAVEQAQANADLGAANNQRTSRLVTQGWASQANGDTDRFTAASRTAALAVAKANITSQQAVVNRLNELAGFEQIKAPFDGVVTARSVNVGDLVNAGGTTGRALFHVADIHRMRVYVNVPQAFFGEMKEGLKATLALPGRDEGFAAQLVSTSNAVAEGSRTALVQLQTDNPDGRLWPGAFAEGALPHRVRPEHAAGAGDHPRVRQARHVRRRGGWRRQGWRRQGRVAPRRARPQLRVGGRDQVRRVAERPADRQPAGNDQRGRQRARRRRGRCQGHGGQGDGRQGDGSRREGQRAGVIARHGALRRGHARRMRVMPKVGIDPTRWPGRRRRVILSLASPSSAPALG